MSKDTVYREDAIAEICKARTPDVVSHQYAELFINAVRRAPSVDRPQGEWIYNGNFCGINHHKCSVCGREEFRMSNFCPNCGAYMKTAEDERDYERAIEQMQHDMLYEPTYNSEDGSM